MSTHPHLDLEPGEPPDVFNSIPAANAAHDSDALRCPKPRAATPSGHSWRIAADEEERAAQALDPRFFDVIFCACETCGRKMLLSAAAPEFPPR